MADGSLIFETKIDSKNLNKQITSLENKANKLTEKMGELANQKLPTDEFLEIQKQIDETSKKLSQLTDRALKLEELDVKKQSKTWKSLQYDISATKRILEEATEEMKILKSSGKDSILGKNTKEYKNLQKELDITKDKMIDLKEASVQTQSSYKNMSDEHKKSMSNIEKTLKRISRKTSSVLLYKSINLMMNSLRTGMQDLAKYSNKLNTSMSNIQSSFIQSRNAISTAFMPALLALEPTIVKVANAFAEFATNVAMYTTALFTNNKTYVRAKKVTTDYAKSLNEVNKAQKALFASFDEIETLNENSNYLGPSYQDMFEEVEIPDKVLENAEKLKNTWEQIKPYILAAGAALGVLALGNEIDKVSEWIRKLTGAKSATDMLNNSMLTKNQTLGEQTKETVRETVALKSLIPALSGAGVGVWALSKAMKNYTSIDFEIPGTAPIYSFGEAVSFMEQSVKNGLISSKDNITTFAKDTNTIFSELYNTETKNSQIFSEILKNNFNLMFSSTLLGMNLWAINIANSAYKAFNNILENSKGGLKTANENVNNFIEATSKGFVSWGTNIIENCGKTMSSWHENFISALASAWESFVSFMAAVGEKISNWWNGNKKWVIPTGIALTAIGAVALAPYTGGGSLSLLPALATGTVVPANYGEFAAILGDNKQEPEIVSPLSTIEQALRNVLAELNITINFEESSIGDLVRMLKPFIDKENRRVGSSTRVTGGAY
ncbi:MAG: hypothetical protein J6B87_02865 [Clostridia bacterium]|nr:hypothetical protein [Clostridia bacterium]